VKRWKTRFGEYYGRAVLQRTVESLRVWEFEHAPFCQIPAHTHERAHLIGVLRGSLIDVDGGSEVELLAGDAMLYPRGSTHTTSMGADGSRSVVFEFEADDLPRILPAYFPQLGRSLVLRGRMTEAVARTAHGSREEIEAAVREMLAEPPANATAEPAWLPVVKAELDRNVALEPDVEALAALAGRHPAHLMRAFRQHVGVTVGEYARARLVARAGEDLKRGEKALSDIALAYGFADQSHFSRTFKRFMNMTPDAYRKAHANTTNV
jgi:AraC family transcriptional regulator